MSEHNRRTYRVVRYVSTDIEPELRFTGYEEVSVAEYCLKRAAWVKLWRTLLTPHPGDVEPSLSSE